MTFLLGGISCAKGRPTLSSGEVIAEDNARQEDDLDKLHWGGGPGKILLMIFFCGIHILTLFRW